MDTNILKFLLALIGLAALLVVLLIAASNLDSSTAAGWTRGGAITIAVSGLFGLLRNLGRP